MILTIYQVQKVSATSVIEEGTFCFKPARSVRFTQANFYAIFGFIFEWVQHTLYVLPTGIISDKQAQLSDYPPYLKFEVYLWVTIACSFACKYLIIISYY